VRRAVRADSLIAREVAGGVRQRLGQARRAGDAVRSRCSGVPIAMTRTPHLPPAAASRFRANLATVLARSRMAHFLHTVALGMLSSVVACAVPPSLREDQPDAGVNAAPVITSVSNGAAQELVEPGPVTLDRGRGTFSVTVRDANVEDTLNVRVYVDYNRPDPTPARASCRVAAGTTASRSTTCDISGVCTTADVGQDRLLWIEVFDRELLESGLPRFRALPAGGASSKWQFFMRCQEPQ
jgi:hypothetical protein